MKRAKKSSIIKNGCKTFFRHHERITLVLSCHSHHSSYLTSCSSERLMRCNQNRLWLTARRGKCQNLLRFKLSQVRKGMKNVNKPSRQPPVSRQILGPKWYTYYFPYFVSNIAWRCQTFQVSYIWIQNVQRTFPTCLDEWSFPFRWEIFSVTFCHYLRIEKK